MINKKRVVFTEEEKMMIIHFVVTAHIGAVDDTYDYLIAFENINSEIKRLGYSNLYLKYPNWLKNKYGTDFKMVHDFFKSYCSHVRVRAMVSHFFRSNFLSICINSFVRVHTYLKSNGIKKDLKHVSDKGWLESKDGNTALDRCNEYHVAYNRLLDFYDAKNREDSFSCFFSLISHKNGEITGVALCDTMDVEMFWDYVLEERSKVEKIA